MPHLYCVKLWVALSLPWSAFAFLLSSPATGSHGIILGSCSTNVAIPSTRCRQHHGRTGVSPLLAGGFGAGGGENHAAAEAPGSAEAKTALESSGGDLDRATSMVFRSRLEKLQQGDEELASMLTELSAAGAVFCCCY